MSLQQVQIPKLGMDTTECDVKAWLVKVGDRVAAGAELPEGGAEKTGVVNEAEVGGVVRELRANVGDRVPIGAVVAVIEIG